LTDLPELVMQEKVESPAVIVIGPVVDMEPELKWFGL